ncbi:MAG: hypothetical protein GX998_04000 [Firmicutes bacterium]|nr:hypothetical protein [Bacillota bacterium]
MLQHEEHPLSNHGNLLASILVRYSQIGTLQILSHSRCMRFGFFAKGLCNSKPFMDFCKHLSDSIEALLFLTNKQLMVLDIRVSRHADFSLIELDRDMDSISLQEISLVVSLLQGYLGANLVCSDEHEQIEDVSWYDDFIQQVLECIDSDTPLQELIGFRENGRVLVFNKSHASDNS